MTVEVTTYYSGPYITNGATTVFPFSFISMDADELGVLLRDADGVDTIADTADYSVTRAADGTGSVSFASAPATGFDLYIFSDVSFAQSVEFEDGSGWKASPVNSVADRSAARDIWLKGRVDRALVAPLGETGGELPSLDNRVGKYLSWDAEGNPVGADGTGADSGLRSDLASSGGSALAGFIQSGTGAVQRSVQSKNREVLSVKDFGATADASTDDTAMIQAAIDAAIANSFSELHFPARSSGNYYKVTSPLVISEPISIRGAGKEAVVIMGVGMSAGEHIIDFDCAAIDSVDHVSISGLTIRSLDGVPNGIRMKNVAYVDCSDVNLFNVYDGITFDGTRCFSHNYDNISPVQIGRNTIRWPASFNGGGHFAFNGSTFSGDVGMAVVAGAIIDGISLTSINFEQCDTHAAVINGTVAGLSINGCRTEANDSTDFVFSPTGANEYIGGLSVTGSIFLASDAGAATRIYLGGGSGKVRGFNVSGNVVTHPTNTFAGKLVELQANAESGVISGNFLRGTDASGAVIINTPTAGVTVFSNENLTGKLPEYWGTATWGVAEGTWTPIDSSGATLSFAAASGRYTKIGRHVFWQAFVTYPATANGSNAVIGGLPFSVGGLSGNSEGRAGGHVDVSNLGSIAGILQGAAGATTISIVNPQTNASLTNANVSAKSFYLSGSYST